MTRPLETEKRRALAHRAVAVLEREGLDVSIARLADALEVKRPTLLYHFPTRSHIVETALEALLLEQTAFVLPRIAAHAHPLERLYAHLCAVHAFHEGREGRIVFLTQAIAASAGDRMAELVEIGNRVFEPYRRAIIEDIRQGIAAGTVRPCDPEALFALTRAVIDGLMVQRVMTGVALAPVHALFWTQVLRPLVIETKETGEAACSESTSGAAIASSASATAASSTRPTRTRRGSRRKKTSSRSTASKAKRSRARRR